MTDEDENRLADLLLDWEELRERGQDTPASELCRDCPHLIEELARRIGALRVTSWLDGPLGSGDAAPEDAATTSGTPRTLLGRYRLDTLIAEGGFARVWRGFDLELQRNVAVKLPKPSRLQSAAAFLAEARRVARLKHPGIVPVFDVGTDGDLCFIVSEFVEGGSLGDHLVHSPPSPQQAVRWIAEIADALEYAHLHGVVHRDIKPANILIDHHNRALLADFGIAQSANKAGQQALSLGTLRYMSPEQLEGRAVDPRSDLFSLGVVLHETLTGRLPYSSAEPNVLRREIVAGITSVSAPDLPAELLGICGKALRHDPDHRQRSAAQFAHELRTFLGRKRSPWRVWWVVTVLIVVMLGLLLAWSFRILVPKEPESAPKPAVAGVSRPPAATVTAEQLPPPANTASTQPNKTEVAKPKPPKPLEVPQPTVDELIAEGQELFDRKQFDRAAEKFAEALRLDPSHAEANDKRGACRYNRGEYGLSLGDFDKAVQLDPQNPEYLKHRATALMALRRFDAAIEDLERALEMSPPEPLKYRETLAIVYSNRAAERSQAERYLDAAADVTEAIKHFPQGNVFYHQRGSCYFNLRQYEKAADDFSEAIRREPHKAAHYLHRGYSLQSLGRADEAARDFEQAKRLGNTP